MHLAQLDPGPTAYNALGLAGFGASLAGLFGWVPVAVAIFAGLAGGVSYSLTIIRDPAIQTWLAKRKQKRQATQIKKLRARQLIVNARIDALERLSQVKAETAEKVQVAKEVAADALKKIP